VLLATAIPEFRRRLQVPDDVPPECPFNIQWVELCVVVQLQPHLDEMAIKTHLIQHHEFKVLNFNLEAANLESSSAPASAELKGALVQARAEGGSAYVPPSELALQLLLLRSEKDRNLGWKIEWVRRQRAVVESDSVIEVHFYMHQLLSIAIIIRALLCEVLPRGDTSIFALFLSCGLVLIPCVMLQEPEASRYI
jgi:hypothetical protein